MVRANAKISGFADQYNSQLTSFPGPLATANLPKFHKNSQDKAKHQFTCAACKNPLVAILGQ